MIWKYKKIIIFGLLAVGIAVLFIKFSGQKSIGIGTSRKGKQVKAEKIVNISEKEKKDYLLDNPFTENNLMPFSVQSDTAIAFDVDTGEVYYAKNVDTKRPTASISKIMTATIVLENIDTKELLTVSKTASEMIPNKIVMKEGEQLKVDDLLYGLMMISANDAAEVLAEGTFDDRGRFIEKMNEKARWLELKNTNFVTPSGMDDPDHYSTPYDLGVILRYAIRKNPEILKYMGTKEHSVFPTDHNESHWWQHISGLLSSYQGMDGAKTGFTWDAGNT
ncbi:hypothetical protein COY62_03645, partial [bacterium (Candidatus Howlettbacteria) CG_4_10_14_0_8_um_filter_40_9]